MEKNLIVTVGTEGSEINRGGSSGSEAHPEPLIKDFSLDLTLRTIAPKLPWKCLGSLAGASPAWIHAIRNREVYDARVSCRALESLVLIRLISDRVALYSTRDGFYCYLPALPIPDLTFTLYRNPPQSFCNQGIPDDCECVTLNGTLYAMGGLHLDFRHVYALDLAALDLTRPKQWKRCASMLQETFYFNCCALDGKIYAFPEDFETFPEVYDPKADTWSLMEWMPSTQGRKLCADAPRAVGEEVLVLMLTFIENSVLALTASVYHPLKHEWRVVELLPMADEFDTQNIFTSKGQLFRMQNGGISVLDLNTGRWMLKHRYSFAGLGFLHEDDEDDELVAKLRKVTAVGDELIVIVRMEGVEYVAGVKVLASEGFGGTNIDVSWHEIKPPPFYRRQRSFWRPIPLEMHPIEL